ncbi:MAG: sulfite exporter TauE/SafE family protein [Hyphomicrobiaceae bacterium]|nr:MAG: sulfite exporter TauE/SafE family protein [Hyphomicrobiaceae bacterium]
MIWIAILGLGLAAGTIGGIVGFGSSIMLMPALMLAFGPLEAVPIMAIAALLANISRVAVWWREVDWRANAFYCATAVPGAALGARTLLTLNPRVVEGVLGVLFMVMVPVRRWLMARGLRIRAWHLLIVGAVIGFLSGLVASTGPINTPFFIAYGLVKGAYLSTEALGSVAIGLTKTIVFQRLDALPWETAAKGLIIGSSVMLGSWVAKGFVIRLDASQFRLLMDALLIVAGLVLLWGAVGMGHP